MIILNLTRYVPHSIPARFDYMIYSISLSLYITLFIEQSWLYDGFFLVAYPEFQNFLNLFPQKGNERQIPLDLKSSGSGFLKQNPKNYGFFDCTSVRVYDYS